MRDEAAQGRHRATRGSRVSRVSRVVPADRVRRRVAAGLLAAGALAATWLTSALDPAAPPAPDRGTGAASSDVAQDSRD